MSGGERYLLRAPQQNVRSLASCKKSGTTRVRGGEQDGGQDSQQDPTRPQQQAHTS